MIINAAAQALSTGQTQTGSRLKALGAGLSINTLNSADSTSSKKASQAKNSLYGNFEKEMSRRLNEAAKKSGQNDDQAADSSILIQSLTGAMGEVEQIFGRQAATEVMAKIISGTADGLTESSLVSAIQNGLDGLNRLDPNGTKMKQLTEGFNRDLGLALDQELAGQKAESKETLSLSYALASHFGSLADPKKAEDSAAESLDGEDAAAGPGGRQTEELYEMFGFSENGRWDVVEVGRLDQAAADELKETAEAGLNRATELTMASFMRMEKGQSFFQDLANYLKNELQDEESAAFVEKAISDSYDLIANQYGSSPKMDDMLSQVYSKVAADGDADKLALFENYINTDFKDAVNPILAQLQQSGLDEALWASAEVGELQFKGINGASLAGESDAFSLNWGYQGDNAYDRSTSKRFLQEDIRGVKAVKEKQDEVKQDERAKLWDNTAEETRLRAEKEGGESDIRSSLGEKYAEERRQNKLDEALGAQFGQLSDSARAELEKYLRDNFNEETADQLLEHSKWNNDLMSGLADIHREIGLSAADSGQADKFLGFMNGTLKKEVDQITEKLGGLRFDGWQASEQLEGALEASFQFHGQDEATTVTMLGLGGDLLADEAALQAQAMENEQLLNSSGYRSKLGTGYLINLVA